MVGADNVVSVQSVKTAECFSSEDSTVSLKNLNSLFWNLTLSGRKVCISSLLVM